jgi:glycosyltransferase involved in cell wall biosynthesis
MITNAESVKQETETLIPAWRKRIRVVPNGYSWVPPTDELLLAASELRKRLGARADELILGVVARLAPQKDPEILINALNLLPDHILQRIRVLWVGAQVDAELARRIRSIAKSHRYAGRLIIIPETRNIRAIYLGIDALLLVSKWEGFPNVLLEALAEGKAVIATDVGDVRYLVKDGRSGWVISAGDESGLADAIQQLVSLSEVRRKEMGQIGARHVREKYSQDRLVENTLAVYREIITLRKYE